MILPLVMMAAIWGIGAAMNAPREARWTMIGLLLIAIIAAHIILPAGHPLREATGGDARFWGLVLAFAAIAILYSRGLGRLKRYARARDSAAEPAAPARSETMSETELRRYARHIVLREVGGAGQTALRNAKVLVVGAGGLGSPVIQYLAAAGVGTLGVIDDDTVDSSNLQRQVLFNDADIGEDKAMAAARAITALNPYVAVKPYSRRLTDEIAANLIDEYDLVLDGTDSFETRATVNRGCVVTGTPLVAGAITQWEGQVSLYDPERGGPCYACIFAQAPDPALAPSCAEAGVIGPLPGVIGSLMAVEAIKAITGAGETLRGRLMIYDALYAETRLIAADRRPDCPVCGQAGQPDGAAPE